MLNYLWTVMLVIGIIVGAATGNMQNISNAVVTSAQEAVELCITMLGIMVMWTGVMKIAQRAGLLDRLSHLFRPVIHFLFPNLPQDHPAGEYISTNCVANILGLGWAATPAAVSYTHLDVYKRQGWSGYVQRFMRSCDGQRLKIFRPMAALHEHDSGQR